MSAAFFISSILSLINPFFTTSKTIHFRIYSLIITDERRNSSAEQRFTATERPFNSDD